MKMIFIPKLDTRWEICRFRGWIFYHVFYSYEICEFCCWSLMLLICCLLFVDDIVTLWIFLLLSFSKSCIMFMYSLWFFGKFTLHNLCGGWFFLFCLVTFFFCFKLYFNEDTEKFDRFWRTVDYALRFNLQKMGFFVFCFVSEWMIIFLSGVCGRSNCNDIFQDSYMGWLANTNIQNYENFFKCLFYHLS